MCVAFDDLAVRWRGLDRFDVEASAGKASTVGPVKSTTNCCSLAKVGAAAAPRESAGHGPARWLHLLYALPGARHISARASCPFAGVTPSTQYATMLSLVSSGVGT